MDGQIDARQLQRDRDRQGSFTRCRKSLLGRSRFTPFRKEPLHTTRDMLSRWADLEKACMMSSCCLEFPQAFSKTWKFPWENQWHTFYTWLHNNSLASRSVSFKVITQLRYFQTRCSGLKLLVARVDNLIENTLTTKHLKYQIEYNKPLFKCTFKPARPNYFSNLEVQGF